jgi:hypothetical protein
MGTDDWANHGPLIYQRWGQVTGQIRVPGYPRGGVRCVGKSGSLNTPEVGSGVNTPQVGSDALEEVAFLVD